MLFALVDAVLLRPVARNQGAVVRIWKNDAVHGLPRHSLSYPEFLALRDHNRTFERLAAINYADASTSTLTLDDRAAVVTLTPVSADFFNYCWRRRTAAGALAYCRTNAPEPSLPRS